MKIIFLDIDGVLNSAEFFARRHKATGLMQGGSRPQSINPDALRRLERLVEETGAEIVVSSTWRIGRTKQDLQKLLRMAGFKYWNLIIGRTPTTNSFNERRGREIKLWLDQHVGEEEPRFVILDDDSDMDELLDHLVKSANKRGLTDEEVDAAVAMLNGGADE